MATIIHHTAFIHIPKCGGTWVRDVFRAAGLKPKLHGPSGHEAHSLDGIEGAGHVFAFVRQPVAWYESFWASHMDHSSTEEGRIFYEERRKRGLLGDLKGGSYDRMWEDLWDKCQSRDFLEFITRCMHEAPAFVSRLYDYYLPNATMVGTTTRLREGLRLMIIDSGLASANHPRAELPLRFPRANKSSDKYRKQAVLPDDLFRELRGSELRGYLEWEDAYSARY